MIDSFRYTAMLLCVMHAQDRVRNNPNVTVHLNTAVLDVFGDGRRKENTQGSPLKGVRIRNTQVN